MTGTGDLGDFCLKRRPLGDLFRKYSYLGDLDAGSIPISGFRGGNL